MQLTQFIHFLRRYVCAPFRFILFLILSFLFSFFGSSGSVVKVISFVCFFVAPFHFILFLMLFSFLSFRFFGSFGSAVKVCSFFLFIITFRLFVSNAFFFFLFRLSVLRSKRNGSEMALSRRCESKFHWYSFCFSLIYF